MTLNEQYLVDVIGFNPVERSMLASIFALAARRDPGFVQYDPASTVGGSADIYLVDAENPDALNEFRTLSKRANLPAVMVGAGGDSMGFPLLPRPLQWARLLQALEETVTAAATPRAAPTRTARCPWAGRSRPAAPAAPPAPTRRRWTRRPRSKRALGDTVLVVDDNASVRMFMKAKLAPSTSRWISPRPARKPWA